MSKGSSLCRCSLECFLAANPDFTPADMRKMQDIQLHDSFLRADTSKYHEWYAIVMSTLSIDHQTAPCEEPNWAQVAANRTLLALVEMVQPVIEFKTTGLADTAQQDVLFSQWGKTCKQNEKESTLTMWELRSCMGMSRCYQPPQTWWYRYQRRFRLENVCGVEDQDCERRASWCSKSLSCHFWTYCFCSIQLHRPIADT